MGRIDITCMLYEFVCDWRVAVALPVLMSRRLEGRLGTTFVFKNYLSWRAVVAPSTGMYE